MIEALVALTLVLAVPVILVAVVLKVVVTLLFLPFKILGFLLKLAVGIVTGVVGLVFSGLGLGLALLAVVAVAILAPLLPFLLVGVVIWLVARAARRPRAVVQVV
jgi:hypothetical protein